MNNTKPNYKDLGASEIMGPTLRQFVEKQLIDDLTNYKVFNRDLKFDWSQSCGEGHSTNYLDGHLENFSYVCVFDNSDWLIAEGWIDFIDNFFDDLNEKKVIVFWDFVTTFNGKAKVVGKTEPGIPEHIWTTLNASFKDIYKANRQKKRPFY